MAVFGFAVYQGYKVELIYDKFIPLAVTAILTSVFVSLFVALRARNIKASKCSPSGRSGEFIS